jgi:hypothetical protein
LTLLKKKGLKKEKKTEASIIDKLILRLYCNFLNYWVRKDVFLKCGLEGCNNIISKEAKKKIPHLTFCCHTHYLKSHNDENNAPKRKKDKIPVRMNLINEVSVDNFE